MTGAGVEGWSSATGRRGAGPGRPQCRRFHRRLRQRVRLAGRPAEHGRHPRLDRAGGQHILIKALTEARDLAAAEGVCAAGLAPFRTRRPLALAALLTLMAMLDLRAGRTEDATAHLREALQINLRAAQSSEIVDSLGCCGTCAPRPGAGPRPSRSGPRSRRSNGDIGFTDVAADARAAQTAA